MNKNIVKQGIALVVMAFISIGCGGGGGGGSSSDDGGSGATTSTAALNPIEARLTGAELDAVGQASLDATIAGIESKLAGQSFSQDPSAIGITAATPTTQEYHLADVIFTIGTDDLGDSNPNELVPNAAYNYFKTYVADAGKLSAEDEAEFRTSSIEDFNDAFVGGYYEAIDAKLGDQSASQSYSTSLAALPAYSSGVVGGTALIKPQFFGFIFKMFNPMTYMGFMMNMAQTVMTAMLAEAFKMMLLSGTMTKMMLRLALNFPILTSVMIHVLNSHWGITRQMIPYLKYDREFGELFMQLAYEQPKMAHFVFQNIDAPLYYGMSVAMTLSQETTERMAIMMNWYSEIYFVPPQPASRYNNFVRLLLNTGVSIEADGVTGHGDGNELANEKLFYSLFKSPLATQQFIRAMEQMDPMMLGALMDHIFLGQQRNPADGSLVVDDQIQGTYNIYAIAQGMLAGMEQSGFGSYIQNLMDFAMIIPEDKYMPYAQKFAMAGYTYYAQSLPDGSPQPSMQDFVQFLMGAISEQMGQVEEQYGEAAQAFGQMLQSLQPYIDEFMQNGMGNMQNAATDGIVPDITDVSGTINDPITDPLTGDVPYTSAPSSLLDVIENFPVLWEKDYTQEAYKGEALSRYNNNKVWESMSTELSELNWMHIPSSANFTYSSRFNFIFETGSVDMYIISNAYSMSWSFNGFSLTDTGETVSVRDTTFNQLDTFNAYRVYKVEIPAGTSLGNLHILMNDVDGIAFDLVGSQPESTVVEPEPTPPPVVTEPVDENGTVVTPVEPPVVVPQVVDISDVLTTTIAYTQKDYSNGAYTSGLVYKPWTNGETWASMSEGMSNLKWMEIPNSEYIYSGDKFTFNFSSGTLDMYFVSTRSNLIWLLDLNGLENVSTSVTSTYSGMNFYVYKLTVNAGSTTIDELWRRLTNVSGIAFDTSNVTP